MSFRCLADAHFSLLPDRLLHVCDGLCFPPSNVFHFLCWPNCSRTLVVFRHELVDWDVLMCVLLFFVFLYELIDCFRTIESRVCFPFFLFCTVYRANRFLCKENFVRVWMLLGLIVFWFVMSVFLDLVRFIQHLRLKWALNDPANESWHYREHEASNTTDYCYEANYWIISATVHIFHRVSPQVNVYVVSIF